MLNLGNDLGRAGTGHNRNDMLLGNYHKFAGNIWGQEIINLHKLCGAGKLTNKVFLQNT